MKTLILAVSLLFLTGCSDFVPMSDGEAKAFNACLDNGWKPSFKVGSASRNLTCERK